MKRGKTRNETRKSKTKSQTTRGRAEKETILVQDIRCALRKLFRDILFVELFIKTVASDVEWLVTDV